MTQFYSTRQAARLLGVKPDTLQRYVWLGRIQEPVKSPSGSFLWQKSDLEKASWILNRRIFSPETISGGVRE